MQVIQVMPVHAMYASCMCAGQACGHKLTFVKQT